MKIKAFMSILLLIMPIGIFGCSIVCFSIAWRNFSILKNEYTADIFYFETVDCSSDMSDENYCAVEGKISGRLKSLNISRNVDLSNIKSFPVFNSENDSHLLPRKQGEQFLNKRPYKLEGFIYLFIPFIASILWWITWKFIKNNL